MRRSSYRWKIVLGLWGPFALQALDTTIIASAFSYIVTDFSTYSLYILFFRSPKGSEY
jgi:MFS family permease